MVFARFVKYDTTKQFAAVVAFYIFFFTEKRLKHAFYFLFKNGLTSL